MSNPLTPHGLQHSRLPCRDQLPELAQTHVYWVSDAIRPSHPLSPSSPPAFNLSQHQGLFQMSWLFTSGDQSIGASTSVFPMNLQGWFPLGWTGLMASLPKELLLYYMGFYHNIFIFSHFLKGAFFSIDKYYKEFPLFYYVLFCITIVIHGIHLHIV